MQPSRDAQEKGAKDKTARWSLAVTMPGTVSGVARVVDACGLRASALTAGTAQKIAQHVLGGRPDGLRRFAARHSKWKDSAHKWPFSIDAAIAITSTMFAVTRTRNSTAGKDGRLYGMQALHMSEWSRPLSEGLRESCSGPQNGIEGAKKIRKELSLRALPRVPTTRLRTSRGTEHAPRFLLL